MICTSACASLPIPVPLVIVTRSRLSPQSGLMFFWSMLLVDARTSMRSNSHCLSTTGGEKVPRPFGPSVHGDAPNDRLQFYYTGIAPSWTLDLYAPMLRDDRSDYKLFCTFAEISADSAVHAIIDCCSVFGVPKRDMSGGPTHIRNETFRLVRKNLNVPYRFTLGAITPSINLAKQYSAVFARSVLRCNFA